jgi:short-chain Z-isoprenyl diphosphate synthase
VLYRLYERQLQRDLDPERLPRHIGVIHDGHRRYARQEGFATYAESYAIGMEKFEEFLGWCDETGIGAVTCWLLSTANLERPSDELEPYYEVLLGLFDRLETELAPGVWRVRFIGSLDVLPADLVAAAKRLETSHGTGAQKLTIALAYGGRQEIVDAVRDLVNRLDAEGVTGSELAGHIDADALARHLYTSDLPDPDLVIRTSGEARLSGFLLWQAAYAEYAFVDVYWPAFRRIDFLRALRDFTRRTRRYGR